MHKCPLLLSAFLLHRNQGKIADFLKMNMKYTLQANLIGHKIELDEKVLTPEKLLVMRCLICQNFLSRSKEWSKSGLGGKELKKLIEIIDPYERLLEAKKTGSQPASLQDSQSNDASLQLVTIWKLYEDLKTKVDDREKQLRGETNIAEGRRAHDQT